MKMSSVIFIFIVALRALARGELVISEILADEPDSRVLLEWLEIFNDGSYPVEMSGYLLVENGDTLGFPIASVIEPGGLAVFCRRLVPLDGSDCFEYRWGDSTGVWGDSPVESYAAFEIGISLANNSGSIYLLTNDLQVVDYCAWDESVDDGRSLERTDVTDVGSPWHACYDPAGSTPGRANSSSPPDNQDYFLRIDPQVVRSSAVERSVLISYAVPPGSEVSMAIYDDTALKRLDLLKAAEATVGQVIWNLKDGDGEIVMPGLYMIVFKLEGASTSRKTVPVVIAP